MEKEIIKERILKEHEAMRNFAEARSLSKMARFRPLTDKERVRLKKCALAWLEYKKGEKLSEGFGC